MLFAPRWRRLVLVIHVATSVGFPGAVAAFLALAIVGATNGDTGIARAAYLAMAIVAWDVIVPLAGASLVVGIIESLGTTWGLLRHYWLVVKLVLTLIAAAVLLLQTSTINMLSGAALSGSLNGMESARMAMVLHGTGGLIVLIVVTVLSVYKPRGMTRYGVRKLASAS